MQVRREVLSLYFTPPSSPLLSSAVSSLKSESLTEEAEARVAESFWFICFNRVEKITPEVFGLWMQILVRTTVSASASAPSHQSEAQAGDRGEGWRKEEQGGVAGGRSSVLVLFSQSPQINDQLRVRCR
jgi:hypothetical protein